MIALIVAVSENRVIGAAGTIPWRIPGEQAYFKRVTMGHPIVMGRKTYESIGKPLPGRPNYVLTRREDYPAPGCHVIHDLTPVLELSASEDVFVIGGADIFEMLFPHADMVYETLVHRSFDGDTFFPELGPDWQLVESNAGPSDVIPHTFNVYRRV